MINQKSHTAFSTSTPFHHLSSPAMVRHPRPRLRPTSSTKATCRKCDGFLVAEYGFGLYGSTLFIKCVNCGSIVYHPLVTQGHAGGLSQVPQVES